MDELVLTFSTVVEKNITTKVHPVSNMELKGLLYDDWIFTNRQRVNQLSNNRIAYSYMKNMSTDELDRFPTGYGRTGEQKRCCHSRFAI